MVFLYTQYLPNQNLSHNFIYNLNFHNDRNCAIVCKISTAFRVQTSFSGVYCAQLVTPASGYFFTDFVYQYPCDWSDFDGMRRNDTDSFLAQYHTLITK